METATTKFNLPTVFVIFGVTGDLMKSKLLPGLFNLYKKNLLPKKLEIIGFSRRPYSDEDLRDYLRNIMMGKKFSDPSRWDAFLSQFLYLEGQFDDATVYKKLASKLGQVDGQWRVCANKLFYLAVPPHNYRTILNSLHNSGLTIPCSPEEGWTRVILEKPFGRDLKNAQELDALLGTLFKEEQIYRVDHFLGKETVRNILAFRFSNSFLAPAWNNKYIEKIEIKLYEKSRVKDRGDFYDGVGALRDVGQNHLLQLLALFTMTHPMEFDAATIRRKRVEILSHLQIDTDNTKIENRTLRGQYEGYADEDGVSKKSQTETYFKIKTYINNSRWMGVPMYLESGKAMHTSRLEVVVTFKKQDELMHQQGAKDYRNVLRYQIQPQEKITTSFLIKKPGHDYILQQQNFEFDYKEVYEREEFIEAYEKLLLDMIKGDQTLFVTTEEILQEWRFVEPILNVWKEGKPTLFTYKLQSQIAHVVAEDTIPELKKEIGIIGLGKMGGNLALQLLENGWHVVGLNRSAEKTNELAKRGLNPAYSVKELVTKLSGPRIILIMLPAGRAVDDILFGKDGLLTHLQKKDIIIDGGNSYFKDTIERAKKITAKHIGYVDVGISGGPKGARRGACVMVGGSRELFSYLLPLYIDISVAGGVAFFEGVGAGHFVKMVHNGIEYGMMQAIAEGFAVLAKSEYKPDLKKATSVYNHGSVIESRLIKWLKQAYELYGPSLEPISGSVAHTGEGAWTVETAKRMGLTTPVIEEALKFRMESEKKPSYTGKVVSALRGQFGGHTVLSQTSKVESQK